MKTRNFLLKVFATIFLLGSFYVIQKSDGGCLVFAMKNIYESCCVDNLFGKNNSSAVKAEKSAIEAAIAKKFEELYNFNLFSSQENSAIYLNKANDFADKIDKNIIEFKKCKDSKKNAIIFKEVSSAKDIIKKFCNALADVFLLCETKSCCKDVIKYSNFKNYYNKCYSKSNYADVVQLKEFDCNSSEDVAKKFKDHFSAMNSILENFNSVNDFFKNSKEFYFIDEVEGYFIGLYKELYNLMVNYYFKLFDCFGVKLEDLFDDIIKCINEFKNIYTF